MIDGLNPVVQALLGTLFTWAVTAAGSALVFVFNSRQVREDRNAQIRRILSQELYFRGRF